MLREKTDFFIQWERRRRKIVDSSHANKFNLIYTTNEKKEER